MANGPAFSIELDGVAETIKAVNGVARDLRPAISRELRDAAGACASELERYLIGGAATSATPVAKRVGLSIKVKRDRYPAVSIGGAMRVGTGGDEAPAARLLWGSEHGPAGEPNHFAAAPNPAGYWIAPTVKAFKQGPAMVAYKAALVAIIRKWRLF